MDFIAVMHDTIAITIHDHTIPDNDDVQAALIDDLGTAIQTTFAKHQVDFSHTHVFDGHIYSWIKDKCPVCGDHLQPIDFEADHPYGVISSVRCRTCGWQARAYYRLVKLHPVGPDDNVQPDHLVDRGQKTPVYVSHTGHNAISFDGPNITDDTDS